MSNRPYRIEAYLHSDNSSENKVGAMVKVTADTDFAVKTDEFKTLAKKIAQLACGFKIDEVEKLLEETSLKEDIKEVSIVLKENIEIDSIFIMSE